MKLPGSVPPRRLSTQPSPHLDRVGNPVTLIQIQPNKAEAPMVSRQRYIATSQQNQPVADRNYTLWYYSEESKLYRSCPIILPMKGISGVLGLLVRLPYLTRNPRY